MITTQRTSHPSTPSVRNWSPRDDPPSRERRANDLMREGLRLLDPAERIPFFCECSRSGCFATVWLSGDEYDRRRANSTGSLVGHAR